MSNEVRTRYFNTLELKGDNASTNALKRAYELRTFEIEHYWKRGTYFWGFQIAIFAAFGLLWKEIIATADMSNEWTPIAAALAGLGVLTAMANALSARGSRFWQRNWEKHIDMLEDGMEGRLYKTVWLDQGRVSFSVSRLNQNLSDCFVIFWIFVLLYIGSRYVEWPPLSLARNAQLLYVTGIGILTALGLCWLWWQRSSFKGSLPDQSGSHGNTIIRCSRWNGRICGTKKLPTFIRRYAPDEFR